MKNILFYAIIFSTVLFSSCSKDDLDVDLQTTLYQDLEVNATSDSGRLNSPDNTIFDSDYTFFSKSAVLSLDNEDTHQYLNKLKNVKIKKLTYKVVDFGNSSGTISAVLYADEVEIHRVENLIEQTNVGQGLVFEVPNVGNNITQIENALLNQKNVTLTIAGNRSCSCPMNFKVRVTADIIVTANPL